MSFLDSAVKIQSKIGKVSREVNKALVPYILIKNVYNLIKGIMADGSFEVPEDARTVDKFLASFNSGFLRPTDFEFYIYPPPNGNLISHPAMTNKLTLMATKTAEIPNITFIEQKIGYGNKTRSAIAGVDYDPVQVTVLCDANGYIIDYFEKWFSLMYNQETFELGYKSEYAGRAEIVVYNRMMGKVMTWTLEGVFPMNKDKIALSYEATDTMMEFSMALNYDSYKFTLHELESTEEEKTEPGMDTIFDAKQAIEKVVNKGSSIAGKAGSIINSISGLG